MSANINQSEAATISSRENSDEFFDNLGKARILEELKKIDFASLPESGRKFVTRPEGMGSIMTALLDFLIDDPEGHGLERNFFPKDFPKSLLGLFSGSGGIESYLQKTYPTIKNTTLVDVEFAGKEELREKGMSLQERDVFEYLIQPTREKFDLVVATAGSFLFGESKPYSLNAVLGDETIRASELFGYIVRKYLPKILSDKAVVMFSAEEGPSLLKDVPGFTEISNKENGMYIYSFDRGGIRNHLSPKNERN